MSQLSVKVKRTTYWFASTRELDQRIRDMDEQIDQMERQLRQAKALQLEFKILRADQQTG